MPARTERYRFVPFEIEDVNAIPRRLLGGYADVTRGGGMKFERVVFLDDGRVEPDTNTVERAIRPIKLSRKNALFAGSDEGGSNWAHLASLVETCKLNGVEPQAYLCELLTRLVNGWPQARIDELMPWCWAKTAQA